MNFSLRRLLAAWGGRAVALWPPWVGLCPSVLGAVGLGLPVPFRGAGGLGLRGLGGPGGVGGVIGGGGVAWPIFGLILGCGLGRSFFHDVIFSQRQFFTV